MYFELAKNIIATLSISIFSGCGHSVWTLGIDRLVNTKFDDHLYPPPVECRPNCGNYFWSSGTDHVFDKIINENEGNRYYITWSADCKCSIYVAPDGVIRSWRFESTIMDNCVVW
jgi:hypothetical protein